MKNLHLSILNIYNNSFLSRCILAKNKLFWYIFENGRKNVQQEKVDRHINVFDINQELTIEQLEKDRYVKRKERLLEKKKVISYQQSDEWKKLEKEIYCLNKQIEEKDRIIHLLYKTKKTIENAIANMKSIERKVFYAHRYLGKSLVEIAAEFEYDYGYIRNLSSKADKKIR